MKNSEYLISSLVLVQLVLGVLQISFWSFPLLIDLPTLQKSKDFGLN